MASPAADTPTAWRMLAGLALAEFFGMTLWFSATAAAPAIVTEFRLSAADAAWLTMAVQGGFVGGTLLSALFNLPDVFNARRLFALGCLAGSMANAAVTVASGPRTLIALRLTTGVALAWVYPPGMKIAAGWFGRNRGAALGLLVGALSVGSAFPHLFASLSAGIPWRTLMIAASACALIGASVIIAVVRDGPLLSKTAPFDPRAVGRVFVNRQVQLATLGYLGHMWELYAMWTWIATFAAASFIVRGEPAAPGASLAAFVAIASGAIGCAVAGFVADRYGKARVAAWAMIGSAVCCALSGFAFGAAPWLLWVLAIVWGVAVVADSALFSALVTEYSVRDYVGTALTVQTCLGFLLTMFSIRLLPAVASVAGWQWVFLTLVPGPVLGAIAMRALDRMTAEGTRQI
jgi:MFS family permease